MYRVTFNDKTLEFDFIDYGDAIGFIGHALENGRLKRYSTDDEPIKAQIEIVDEEVGLNE